MPSSRVADSTPRARWTATPALLAEHPISRAPDDLGRVGAAGESVEEEALLRRGQLESAHDLEEGAAAVAAVEQGVVGVDLRPRHSGAVGNPLQVEDLGEGRRDHAAQPELADAAVGKGVHRPGAVEAGRVDQGVEGGQREDPIGVADRPLEADRSADVVDDEVAALDLQGVDRGTGPGGEAAPGVVEAAGALGQPQAGEVEGDAAQAAGGEQRHDLAVEEAADGDAVNQDHRLAVATVEREAADAGRLERRPAASCASIARWVRSATTAIKLPTMQATSRLAATLRSSFNQVP